MQLNNDYKILVAITNFHNPNRTKYLDKVLQNLQNFVITTDVIVVTNIDRKLEFGRTRCYDVSKDPFSLTWKHKELWIEYQNDYTHFILRRRENPYLAYSQGLPFRVGDESRLTAPTMP